ncbi:MAG: 3-keto-disaccharide hydrolase [Planctomycetota bacterium]|jgi:hypothetical protein
MRTKLLILVLVSIMCLAGCSTADSDEEPIGTAHNMNAPRPPVVTPGKTPSDPPSHAIVLFDGTDLSEWVNEDGEPTEWVLKNGFVQCNQTGSLVTKREFGSCHLHIEWATPAEVEGRGQGRGNSGIYFMSNYEVQILDSYPPQYMEEAFLW